MFLQFNFISMYYYPTHIVLIVLEIFVSMYVFVSQNLVFTSQLEKQSIKICRTECNQSNEVFGCSLPTCERLRCWNWQVELLCYGIYITVLTSKTYGLSHIMSNRCTRHSWGGEGQTTDHIQAAPGNLLQ